MAMLLLLDSNFRASVKFGSRQLLPVFSDAVQSGVRGAPDCVSLVSQISYYMRTLPSASKVTLIFGSFKNILNGQQSAVQHFPMMVVREEIESYVGMLRDLLRVHPAVSVYILAPLYRRQPVWYEAIYGEMSNLFCSSVSHLDPARVKVVPAVEILPRHLDQEGFHFDKDAQQLVVNQLLSFCGWGFY